MRNLKKISDEQIMMASRIANQAVSRAVTVLIKKNSMFSLTDTEIETLEAKEIASWLYPSTLSSKQNFVMKPNGNLMAHVQIFNDNTIAWSGEILTPTSIDHVEIKTNPEKSYFSLDLAFEIDTSGSIKACVAKNFTSTREVAKMTILQSQDRLKI